MTKVAVVLAGCGHQDGAEIRESVITLLELDKHDANVTTFAPNSNQHHVINHITGDEMSETRNIMVEAGRIARGEIKDLNELNANDFDALIMPGGFGTAKNLSDIAFKGGEGKVIEPMKKAIQSFLEQKKVIGAICISPAIVASALQGIASPTLTLGEPNELLGAFGANEEVCSTDTISIDNDNKIVSCSAYMRNDRLSNVAKGIEKLVAKVMELAS